ncbi:hypothetical protein [Haloferula sp.]|uniref:hypothetical protein n=1 Tax=Haloferula sp. TaxID=2497595 RepID=UPI003C788895
MTFPPTSATRLLSHLFQRSTVASWICLGLVAGAAPSDVSFSGSDIPELTVPGAGVGTLALTDPDGSESYTFDLVAGDGDDHNGFFLLNSDQVQVNAALDFEVLGGVLSIRVEVRDTSGVVLEQAVAIGLLDDRTEDADGDGLSEADEEDLHSSSDLLYDTDGDGFGDAYEVANGTLPGDDSSKPTGSVILAWGSDVDGQLTIPGTLGEVAEVSAGLGHNLALRSDGSVAAWGRNIEGQSTVPSPLAAAIAVAAGDRHSLCLLANGSVVAWGSDVDGQSTVPNGLTGVVEIAAGSSHSMALKSNGTVVVWGSNSVGQSTVPAGLSGVVDIAAGGDHCLALLSDGTVAAWGRDDDGEITGINAVTGVIGIGAGLRHVMALTADGEVLAWGDASNGQTSPPAGTGNLDLSAGGSHGLLIDGSREVQAWGMDDAGQSTPPFEAQQVRRVSAGESHSVALRRGADYPEVSSEKGIVGVIGDAFSHQLTVANAIPTAFGAMSLPAGLSLNPATGMISGELVDTEAVVARVWADTDQGRLTQLLLIEVFDAAPPTAIFLTPATVSETALEGSVVGVLTALDPDAVSSHSFSLDNDPVDDPDDEDNGLFSIIGNELVLDNDMPFDFEDGPMTFSINVMVVDGAFNTLTQSFVIVLTDDRDEDFDRDGLTEAEEEDIYGTSDLNFDGDGDGFLDSVEITFGSSPFDANDMPAYSLVGWGGNSSGQLLVPYDGSFRTLDIGQQHSVAQKFDGSLAAWGGDNEYGQTTIPVGLSGVAQVAAGGDTWTEGAAHSLALLADGTVVGWGCDEKGQATPPVDLSGVVSIAAGRDHSLALKGDGTVLAWGGNFHGQTDVPVGLSNVVAISAGGFFSLALKDDGTVAVWGGCFDGNNWVDFDEAPGLSDVVAISAGRYHALALRIDGTVVAWGHDSHGQLQIPAGLSDVVSISAGGFHNLALKANGEVVGWGMNDYGQTSVPMAATSAIQLIEAGLFHSVAIQASAGIPRITSAKEIQTSLSTAVNHQVVVSNATPTSFMAMGLPPGLSMDSSGLITGSVSAVTRSSVRIWADTDKGQVEQILWVGAIDGVPATDIQLSSSQVNENAPEGTVVGTLSAVDADALDSHVFALVIGEGSEDNSKFRIEGNLLVVGAGFDQDFEVDPQLQVRIRATDSMLNPYEEVVLLSFVDDRAEDADGDGLTEGEEEDLYGTSDVLFDSDLDGFSDAFELAQGSSPIDDDSYPTGSVLIAWGENGAGQTDVPSGLDDATAIAAGSAHNLVVKGDGSVVAWGSNSDGQLGVPVGLSNVTAVAAGEAHSLALKDDGTVVAWGRNLEGQASVPTDLSGVVAIAAGGHHSLALVNDGSVVAWGSDAAGESTVPPGLGVVVAIAAGADYSVALQSDGSVMTWGETGSGQFLVSPDLREVIDIAAGRNHVLTLMGDGTIIGWGDSSQGQINIPDGLDEVVKIAAGDVHSLALRNDGTVVAWGGAGSRTVALPFDVDGAELIASGVDHGLVLRAPDGFPSISEQSAVKGTLNAVISQAVTLKNATGYAFEAIGLPPSMSLDQGTGLITGTVAVEELRSVLLIAYTDKGVLTRVVQFNTIDGVSPSTIVLDPAEVVENAEDGRVVGRLQAIDADPLDSHTYALNSGSNTTDNEKFRIEGDLLVVDGGLTADFESHPGELIARVIATDLTGNREAETFQIVLLNDWSEDEDGNGFSQAEEAYFSWATTATLSGGDENPTSMPFGDGVMNLLKYAFNLDGTGPDRRILEAGTGTAGLPRFEYLNENGEELMRLEYIRKSDGSVIYTPVKGLTPNPEGLVPFTATPVVTEIDAVWERVVVEEPCEGDACFFRVKIELP